MVLLSRKKGSFDVISQSAAEGKFPFPGLLTLNAGRGWILFVHTRGGSVHRTLFLRLKGRPWFCRNSPLGTGTPSESFEGDLTHTSSRTWVWEGPRASGERSGLVLGLPTLRLRSKLQQVRCQQFLMFMQLADQEQGNPSGSFLCPPTPPAREEWA